MVANNVSPRLSVVVPLGSGKSSEVINSLNAQEVPVTIILERGPNPSANRNRGAKKVSSEFVGFVNGHSSLPNDWSRRVLSFFDNHKDVAILGGPQKTPKNSTFFQRVSGYALVSKFGSGSASVRYGGKRVSLDADETMITSSNLVCRKKVFSKVSFDESLYPGEDPKFISDSKVAGFRVAYDPKLVSYNQRRGSLVAFSKQNFSFGYVRPKKEGLLESFSHPSFVVPSLFLLYLIFLGPLSMVSGLFIIPALLYIFLAVVFSLFTSIRNLDFFSFFVLPFLFFTIHITYGLGFLWGTLAKLFGFGK